jgi:1,2-phenylacetyl-CoA epoxidase PaaB subunit
MAKKLKPLPRWRVSLIKGTPAKMLGFVHAADEKSALAAAAEDYKIAEALRRRLVARRDE